jgi:outer membrane protein
MFKSMVMTIVAAASLAAAAPAQTARPQATAPPATAPQSAAGAGQKTRIALLAFPALREGIGELKQRYQKLQQEFSPRATELDAMQNSIASKEKVAAENKTLTAPQAQKLAEEIAGLKKDYQRKLEDAQEQARKREAEETSPVLEKINNFLEKYCSQRGITHVYDVARLQETGAALYAAPGANITEDFIREYNKANPAPAAAAPATAAPKKP